MTVSEELKVKILRRAWGLFRCVETMRDRLDPGREDKDASKIMQEADGLWAEIKDLLEIEE